METEEKIFDCFNQGKTLIFPTEIAARSNACNYVLKTGKTLFLGRSLSFDSFKNKCRKVPEGKQPATIIHRILFVRQLFEKDDVSCELRYFRNREYRQSDLLYQNTLVENLPSFFKVEGDERFKSVNKDCYHDICLIYHEYLDFLEQNSLFETNYIEPDFSICDKDNYILVFPDAVRDTDVEIAEKYIDVLNISADLPVLNVYRNTVCEVRQVMRNIYSLLSAGKRACDFAITLTDFNQVLPVLQEEAEKRSILLNPIEGKKLLKFNAGSLFQAFADLKAENFSFKALKRFLLNPSYPFRFKEENSALIRELADNNTYGDLEINLSKTDRADYLKKLADFVNAITGATTVDNLRRAINGFQDEFFIAGSFTSTDRDEDIFVFRKCMDLLDELETCPEAASQKDIWGLFLQILSQTTYTLNLERPGIKVYRYPVSCAHACPYHFVIGLDDEKTSISRRLVPFLNKSEEEDGKFESNGIGNAIIKSLCCSENLNLSCARQTFSGEVTIASLYAQSGFFKEINNVEKDSFSSEEEGWKNGKKPDAKSSKFQKECFDRIQVEKIAEGHDYFRMPEPPEVIHLSATSLNGFAKCPFRWMCSSINEIEDVKIEPESTDYPEIGTVLHSTYEDYFNNCPVFDDLASDSNQKNLKDILSRKFNRYGKSRKAPDPMHVYRLKYMYDKIIGSIVFSGKGEPLHGCRVVAMEKEFTFKGDGFDVSGVIDCILVNSNGDYLLVDFKKNNVEKNSLQLMLYSKALSLMPEFGKPPVESLYYSIDQERFISADNHMSMEEFDSKLKEIAEKIRNKEFEPTPSNDSCRNCDYVRVCRARYVIK